MSGGTSLSNKDQSIPATTPGKALVGLQGASHHGAAQVLLLELDFK